MPILNINGFDLTDYANSAHNEKSMEGFHRSPRTKRNILIEFIELLSDDTIEAIFDSNTIVIERRPNVASGENSTD